jgi:hypothetical protein
LTRLLLAVTLLGTTTGAAAAATRGGGRAECPMSRSHACCKKSRQKRRAPGVAPARLCCVVDFPQPAPAGTNFTLQPPHAAASDPQPHAPHAPGAPAAGRERAYSPPFRPSHSPPAYIQHASFLI